MRYPISNATLDAGDVAILGRKGSGKTYTAKGLVERLIKRGRRVIVIDPMSIWWGLRLAADGVAAGLPVLVVGGEHADIPLADPSSPEARFAATPEAGARVARALLATTASTVIDVADIRRPANLLFVAALLRELYETHTREPLWIVLEEADLFAPQFSRAAEDTAVLAEVEMLVRRGRGRGFRLITITQRPAAIHKAVLSQIDTMIALNLPGLPERKTVRQWMEGVVPDARAIFNALPTLPVGEAFVWTPQQRKLEREKFPTIMTFDTSSTPQQGVRRLPAGALSEKQLAELREAFGVGVATTRLRRTTKRKPTAAGAAITRLRERLNLSQQDLAEKIGGHQKSLSRAESGETFVSTSMLETIAEKTGHELVVEFRPGSRWKGCLND